MEQYAKLAAAVLDQAVLDLHIGKNGRTLSGNPYPGIFLNRRRSTRNRMRGLRKDARAFFFDPLLAENLNFWFSLSAFRPIPRGKALKKWIAERIDARHPREGYSIE